MLLRYPFYLLDNITTFYFWSLLSQGPFLWILHIKIHVKYKCLYPLIHVFFLISSNNVASATEYVESSCNFENCVIRHTNFNKTVIKNQIFIFFKTLATQINVVHFSSNVSLHRGCLC